MPARPPIARAALVVGLLLSSGLTAGCAAETSAADPERSDLTLETIAVPAVEGSVDTVVERVELALDEVGEADSPPAEPLDVVLVGDSVLVGVADDLTRARGRLRLRIDAVECRRLDPPVRGPCGSVPSGTRITSGLDAIERAMGRGTPDVAVLILANNAAITTEGADAAMAALEGVPRVWWVTTRVDRGWQDSNNEVLADLAERSEAAEVIDWHAASRGRPWLRDGVHPNADGQKALAGLIIDHVTCDCEP